jgi:hypothetical protein
VALELTALTEDLLSSPEVARQRCGTQLQNGAPLRVWVSASERGNHLARIYSVRADHVRRIALPVLGIEEAVHSFQDHADEAISLATVEGDDGYKYSLFVSAVDDQVVACIGTPAHD